MPRVLRRLRIVFALLWPLIGCASVAAVLASQPVTAQLIRRLSLRLTAWTLWSAFTPVVVWAAMTWPLRARDPRPGHLGRHVMLVLSLVAVHLALLVAASEVAWPAGEWLANGRGLWPAALTYGILNYCVICGSVAVVRHERAAKRSALTAARLELRLAQTDVANLQIALQPEEISAELSRIGATMTRDPAQAESRLVALSDDLRHRLQSVGTAPSTPHPEPHEDRRWPMWRRLVGVALTYPAFGAYLNALYLLAAFNSAEASSDVARMAVAYLLAGALSPLVVYGIDALGDDTRSWRRHTVAAALALAHAAITELLLQTAVPAGHAPPRGETFLPLLIFTGTVAHLLQARALAVRAREDRRRAAQLSNLLAQSRLRALRAQLAPHFLFNTLNSVVSLVRSDTAAAETMLQQLERLMSATVGNDRQAVPLRDDLELTNAYLEIQRARFGHGLDVRIEAEDGLLDVLVPSLMLQPLVENAIRHGTLSAGGRGVVDIRIRRFGSGLTIAVENDGIAGGQGDWREGVGLSSLRARLDHLYGKDQRIRIGEAAGNRIAVRILLARLQKAPA